MSTEIPSSSSEIENEDNSSNSSHSASSNLSNASIDHSSADASSSESDDIVNLDDAAVRAHTTFRCTNWVVRWPIACCLLFLLIPVILSVIAFASLPVEIDYGLDAFVVRDHPVVDHADGVQAAFQRYAVIKDPLLAGVRFKRDVLGRVEQNTTIEQTSLKRQSVPLQSIRTWGYTLIFMHNQANGNVLTKEHFEAFRKIEQDLLRLDGYSQFCWISLTTGECHQPSSLIPFVYPECLNDGSGQCLPNGKGTAIIDNIDRALLGALRYGFYYYTDENFSPDNLRSRFLRVQMSFGSPLRGFRNRRDQEVEQTTEFLTHLDKHIEYLQSVTLDDTLDTHLFYGGGELTNKLIVETVYSDASYAIGSLLCILVLLWAFLRSFFLALFGAFQVVLSFPTAYAFYRIVLQNQYVGILNAIALFLIIGIGVDDVFVFFGAFRQSKHLELNERMAATIKRAGKSTFITSLTTAACFAVSIPSGIPALSLFGQFMVTLVVVNYLLVISFFLSVLVVWERYVRRFEERVGSALRWSALLGAMGGACARIPCVAQSKENVELGDEFSLGDKLFYSCFAPFIHRTRYFWVALANVLLIVCLIVTTQLDTSREIPRLFHRNTTLQRFLDYASSDFVSRSVVTGLNIAYGCDGRIGSNLVYDRCLVCGGDNSCLLSPTPSPVPTTPFVPFTMSVTAAMSSDVATSSAPQTSAQTSAVSTVMETTGVSTTLSMSSTSAFVSSTQVATTTSTQAAASSVSSTTAQTAAESTSGAVPSTLPLTTPTAADTSSNVPTTTEAIPTTSSSTIGTTTPAPTQTTTLATTTALAPTPPPYTTTTRAFTTTPRPTPPPTLNPTVPPSLPTPYPTLRPPTPTPSRSPVAPTPRPSVDPRDCRGVLGGTSQYDACGVCDGDNECVPEPPASSNQADVSVWVGIQSVDRSASGPQIVLDGPIGEPIYDNDFNLNSADAQLHLAALGERLRDTLDDSGERLCLVFPYRNVIAAFGQWLRDVNQPFPVTGGNVAGVLLNFLQSEAGRTYRSDVVFESPSYRATLGNMTEKRQADLDVKMVRILLTSATLRLGTGSFEALDIYEQWQRLLEAENEMAPPSVGTLVHVCSIWQRMITEVSAVRGVIWGVVVAAVVSLVCLLVFTSNFLVATLALLAQISTVFSVLCVYYVIGWTLGAIEAISVTILLGLSLDLFFHLAEAYSQSASFHRRERTRDALTRMGVSVLGGAITTLVSSMFLFGAQIYVFYQFGLVVVINMLLSIVYSFVFFMAHLTLVGPSGDVGNILYLLKLCYRSARGQRIDRAQMEREREKEADKAVEWQEMGATPMPRSSDRSGAKRMHTVKKATSTTINGGNGEVNEEGDGNVSAAMYTEAPPLVDVGVDGIEEKDAEVRVPKGARRRDATAGGARRKRKK